MPDEMTFRLDCAPIAWLEDSFAVMSDRLPPTPSSAVPSHEHMDKVFLGSQPVLSSKVEVVDYDPHWPSLYESERARISSVLTDAAISLHHVGSTSVPGLAAKPVIDIDLIVANSANEATYLPALEGAGYRLVIREEGWEEHRAFKGPDTNVNLHVWSDGADEPARHLLFRDWLREHPEDRDLYAATKRQVALEDWKYISDYNAAKAPVIRDIYARIFASRAKETAQ